MSEKKDQLKEILKDQLNREAKQIEEEVGLNDNEEIPNELKIRMKNALDQKIREREKRSEDMKRTDAYAKLSEEDQEALRIGREMMKNQSEEKKIYTMRRKKRNIRRVVALAAVLILVCGSVMTSVGSKSYWKVLWERENGDENSNIINVEDMETKETDDEFEVDKKITKTLGISRVRMEYKPDGMILKKYVVDEEQRRAILFYQYENEIIRYAMYMNSKDSSLGQKTVDKLLNEYVVLNGEKEITVKEYEVKDMESRRYVAEFEYKGVQYQLKGVIKKDELDKIIEKLFFV